MNGTVYGVGTIGVGKYKSGTSSKKTRHYSVWMGMMSRCYSEKSHKEKPTYKDCLVCDEWLNFQNFAAWYDENYPDDGDVYDLDKDVRSSGCKIYSPETCSFISHQKNSEFSFAKRYALVSPAGEIVEIYNMAKFCRENDLCNSNLCNVANGKLGKYKGWTRHG